jgi:hypothetical protein
MLKLLAIAPADGWAYVEEGGKMLLVRPPYAPFVACEEIAEALAALRGSEEATP